MRPIDADALKQFEITVPRGDGYSDVVFAGDIHMAPTLDVAPVIHGEWIKMSDADGVYFACSECGEDIPRIAHYNPQFDLFPKMESIDRTRFCPSCGARMDGGKNDGT